MQNEQFLLSNEQLRPLVAALMAHSSGPREAAAICLTLFIGLWSEGDPEGKLEAIAETARTMILSYHQQNEPLQ